MKIISFLNSKGGVGKTTLCVNLADDFYQRGKSVLVVDADPQGSVRDWREARGEDRDTFDILAADRKHTLLQLESALILKQYEYVLIDTPGKLTDLTSTAITLSDLCLLPVQPSAYDIWSTQSVIELVKIRQEINKKLKAAIIINRAIPNTLVCKEALAELRKCEIPVLNQVISQRVAYAHAVGEGQTVFNLKNRDALIEISGLCHEIEELFDEA